MKCLKWKKVTLQLTWMSFLQNCEVSFIQERLPITYRNFRHKSLVRPKSKSPKWQGSQPINYKAKFSQRDNIYPLDLKYNITYQNIREKSKVRPIFIPWNAYLATYINGLSTKISKFIFIKKVYQWRTIISLTKVWSDPKVNAQIEKDLSR